MSQSGKSAYYKALKDQGVEFDRHYRDYTTEELKGAYDKLVAAAPDDAPLPAVPIPPAADVVPPRSDELAELREQIGSLGQMLTQLAHIVTRGPAVAAVQAAPAAKPQPPQPVKPKGLDPLDHAGVTMNTHAADEPVRVDEFGNQWYRNEVNKPGFPKPRGRRVLRAMDSGTVQETIQVAGGYTETFEIPGDPLNAKPIEIKVTLPSYQTGIYKAPNMPFKIHTYQGVRGFDWDDINRYYGAADLVPSTIKHCYVSSDLCYDISTTIRAIEDEFRERVLKKESLR